jgi:preprotein translocase subunit YajC
MCPWLHSGRSDVTRLEEAPFVRQLVSLLPFIAIFALMWLFMIRPAQRRQAEALRLQRAVEVGDEVVLTSGIFGTVAESTDDHLGIEIAEGVTIRVLRGAIASKVHRDDESEAESEADEATDTPDTTDGARVVEED